MLLHSHLVLILLFTLTACVGSGGKGDLFSPAGVTSTDGDFPGCISGDALDSSRIKVDFAWPADASKMDIYRNGGLVASFTHQSVTSFIDVNLQEGGSYQYRCDAEINGISKQGTNILSLEPINVNPPVFAGVNTVAPKANDPENDSITVTWNPANSAGPLVSYYKIYAKPGCSILAADFNAAPALTSTLGNLSATIDGIGDEIPFSFAVRACTASDICDTNTTVKYTTAACADSGLADTGAPRTVGATAAAGLSGYRVQLTAPWDYGKGAVKYRYVYASTTSASAGFSLIKTQVIANADLGNPITSIILSSMLENTTYYFKVIDEDPSGNSNNSTAVIAYTTGDLTAPAFSGVSNAVVGTPADTKINLTWVAIEPQTSIHQEGAKNYLIYANYVDFSTTATDPADACETATLAQTVAASNYVKDEAVTYAFTALPRKIYSICVEAIDEAGNISSSGNSRIVTTRDLTAPQFFGIQSLTYDAAASSIAMTWNPSSSSDTTVYKVVMWKNSFTEPTNPAVFPLNPTTYAYGKSFTSSEFSFTSNDVIYAYVNACDDADLIAGGTQNCTTYSTALSRSLPDVDPPANFGGILSANPTTNGALTADWANPVSLVDYAGFKVYSADSSNNLTLVGTCTCSVPGTTCPTTCAISNLNANRTYSLHVRAYDSVGNLTTYLDPASSIAFATTPDTIAPVFSSIISYTADTPANYLLSWAPATDNQYASEPGAKLAYRLYRKTTSDFTTNAPYSEAGVSLITTITDTYPAQTANITYSELKSNLVDATAYYYRACAQDTTGVNASGNSNLTCVNTSTVLNTPDITEPQVLDFAHTRTSKKQKKWAITFKMADNLTANTNLIVKVYRKSSANAVDLATAIPANSLSQGSVASSPSQYTLSRGTDINDTTIINDLTGPRDTSTYIHYLVRVQDSAGNITENYLTLYSDNAMTVTSVVRNQILKAGGEWVVIIGTGFFKSLDDEHDFGTNSTVNLGGYSCTKTYIVNSTKILCKTPMFASPTTITVTVTNPDGSVATAVNAIAVMAAATGVGGTTTYCDDGIAWPRCVDGTSAAGCSGNSANPYLICSESDLNTAKASASTYFNSSSKYFVMGNHIDFTASTNYSNYGYIYAGITAGAGAIPKIDGKNYFLIKKTITGISNTGLFAGFIAPSNRPDYRLYIKDLGVYDLQINGFTGSANQVGGLFGYLSYGAHKLENITMDLTVTSDFQLSEVAGLFGQSATVTADNQIINSWVRMNASFSENGVASNWIAGLGGNLSGRIINTHTEGNIVDKSGLSGYIGGFAGYYRRTSVDCDAALGETDSTCGIVASNSSMIFSNVRNYTGGLIAHKLDYAGEKTLGIHRSYFDGRIEYSNSSRAYIGGLIGYAEVGENALEIKKSYAAPEDGGYLIKNYITPVASNSDYIGGLIGGIANTTLGAWRSASISESYSQGRITSESSYIGGLVGRIGNLDLTIANSYSKNIISNSSIAAEYVGGLVGGVNIATATLTLQDNFFAGQLLPSFTISGSSNLGPMLGYLLAGAVYTESDNYFDIGLCGPGTCLVNGANVGSRNGGQGRTTADMKDSVSYSTNYAGFDFSTIWTAPVKLPVDYPRLLNSP